MRYHEEPLNPYASPHEPQPAAFVAGEPRLGLYLPRLAPRDGTDYLLLIGVGVPGAVLVYGLPLGFIFLFRAPVILVPVAVLCVVVAAISAVLAGIQRLTVAPQCIVAKRWVLP